jgi:hypothetical protein
MLIWRKQRPDGRDPDELSSLVMQAATVEEVGMWLCSATAGAWVIVPAALAADGRLQMRPDDIQKLGPGATIDGRGVLQIAECRVDGMTTLVLFAHHPSLARADWRSLAEGAQAKFEGAPVIVVLEASEGHLRVDTSFCDRDEPQRTASFMAAAVIQSRWTLDESARIRIECGRQVVGVEPRFDGERWQATLIESDRRRRQ